MCKFINCWIGRPFFYFFTFSNHSDLSALPLHAHHMLTSSLFSLLPCCYLDCLVQDPCWTGLFIPWGGSNAPKSDQPNKCKTCPRGFVTGPNEKVVDSTTTPTTTKTIGAGEKSCNTCPSGRFYTVHSDWFTRYENGQNDDVTPWYNKYDESYESTTLPSPKCEECIAGKARTGRMCKRDLNSRYYLSFGQTFDTYFCFKNGLLSVKYFRLQ